MTAVGHGQRLTRLGSVGPSAYSNRVVYRHAGVREWYRNGPLGIEQGFTLTRRPAAGAGWLTLSEHVSGRLVARRRGPGLVFTRPGSSQAVVRYGGLTVTDATGRSLPARLQLAGGTVLLRVDDAGARYPLTIDPFIQQGPVLYPDDDVDIGPDPAFGWSVAISGDGSTALIGAPNAGSGGDYGPGAAFMFTRSGSAWSEDGSFTPSNVRGGGDGTDVALSYDGDTALVTDSGSDNEMGGNGGVFAYARSGSNWTQISSPQPSDGTSGFLLIYEAALSGDGNTAVVSGAVGDMAGTWVFSRSGSTWTQQGPGLPSSGSVAISGDGQTVLIGTEAPGALVFTRSGSTWTQQGPELIADDAAPALGSVGFSVALSSDGNTALIGGPNDNNGRGAAWGFTRWGSTWTQDGAKLTPPANVAVSSFGFSVSLSGDGRTALVGGNGDGAPLVFSRSGSTWTQQGPALTPSDASDLFGIPVALSADASTALVGEGAAWVLARSGAMVTAVAPSAGETSGGNSVSITGSGFTAASGVRFGAVAASFTVNSDTSITAVAPAHPAGTIDVSVTTPAGTSPVGNSDLYAYASPAVSSVAPGAGPTAGQNTVKITGTSFVPGETVDFGSTPSTSVTFVSPNRLTAIAPAHAAGTVDVTVHTPAGASATSPADQYFYGGATGVTVGLVPGSIVADGSSTSTATATVTDANGNPVPGHSVGFSSSDPGQRIGLVIEHGDGSYTATVTSSSTPGSATITATDSTPASSVSGQAILTQTAPATGGSGGGTGGTGGGGTSGSAAGTTPQATALSVSPTRFELTGRRVKGHCVTESHATRRKPTCTRKIALRVTYALTTPARVSFKIKRESVGRLLNGRCLKPTRKNHRRHRCTRLVAVPGTLILAGSAGTNRFVLDGQVGAHRLAPGSYQLTLMPTAGGRTGAARSAGFQILR